MDRHCSTCNKTFVLETCPNFCVYCGAKMFRKCPSCQSDVEPTHKFCASCGANLGNSMKSSMTVPAPSHRNASTTSTIRSSKINEDRPNNEPFLSETVSDDLKLEDVRMKLKEIREKRNSSEALRSTVEILLTQNRKSCTVIRGVKRCHGSKWIQMKGSKKNPSFKSPIKKTFKKGDNYSSVLQELKSELGFLENDCSMVLLDMSDNEISKDDQFTIQIYVVSCKKYAGSTRIYLGIKEGDIVSPETKRNICEGKSENESLTEKYNFDTVKQFVLDEYDRETYRGDTDIDVGDLCHVDSENYCPVFSECPKVQLFQKRKK